MPFLRDIVFHPDPLGAAILDYHRGDADAMAVAHCLEANSYEMTGAYMFRSLGEYPISEMVCMDACTGHILDIGAGAGAHALWLMDRGYTVTALDTSPASVQVMQERGISAQVQDVMEFRPETRFDTLLLMMNGIGLTGTLEGLEQFFRHAKEHLLAPGGQLLFDSSDMRYLYEVPRRQGGGYRLPMDRYYGELSYQIAYRGKRGRTFKWLYVDFDTMSMYAEQAGFEAECLVTDEYAYAAKLILK